MHTRAGRPDALAATKLCERNVFYMKKIAVIGAVLENPTEYQTRFNEVVSAHKHMIRGRMGLPLGEENIALISIAVTGTMDEINSLTGKLGKIPTVSAKATVSAKSI